MKTLIILLLLINFSFSQITKIDIINHYKSETIPSASGIEYLNKLFYVISDDMPHIFQSADLQNFTKTTIVKNHNTKPIEKLLKPDFEALSKVILNKKTYLLIVSSGSKIDLRDTIYLFDIATKAVIAKRNFRSIFEKMKLSIKNETNINIEAATQTSDKILLFQRGNIANDNFIYFFNKTNFIDYLLGKTNELNFSYESFKLPQYNGIQSGFSGATMINDYKILFTASLETNHDAYTDGEIIGSYIGTILTKAGKISCTLFTDKNKKPIPTKLESVVIKNKLSNTKYNIIISGDNDNGISDFFELNIETIKWEL